MEFTGIKPHPKQLEIIKGVLNGGEKFHTAAIGRQFGKTLMCINLCLYWAINEPDRKIIWISPVYSQAKEIQKKLFNAIKDYNLVESNNFSSNELKLTTGSEILFRSAERFDNIRGLTCDYGIIDEAAFIKDEAWKAAIRPIFAVRGKKVVFISTPKGKNFFYQLYQLGLTESDRYKSYQGTSYDTPYIEKAEIEDAQRTLPEQIFNQEYRAKFIDAGGEVFNTQNTPMFSSKPKPIGKVYAGLDLGRHNDWTVLTLIDSEGNLFDWLRIQKTTWDDIIDKVVDMVKKYNATLMIEVNSIGDVIHESIRKKWSNTHPFQTSAQSKKDIIEGMQLDLASGKVKIPSPSLWPELNTEIEQFTYTWQPKSRQIKYSAPDGLHDDIVMSLAIALYNSRQNIGYGEYSVGGLSFR